MSGAKILQDVSHHEQLLRSECTERPELPPAANEYSDIIYRDRQLSASYQPLYLMDTDRRTTPSPIA